MKAICGNCIYWHNGECEVKYGDNRTTSNHECDEVMDLFELSTGRSSMFFAPDKSKTTRK